MNADIILKDMQHVPYNSYWNTHRTGNTQIVVCSCSHTGCGDWLGKRLINLQIDSGIRDREKVDERDSKESKNRDRSSNSVCLAVNPQDTSEDTATVSENHWISATCLLSVVQSQVSFYGMWRSAVCRVVRWMCCILSWQSISRRDRIYFFFFFSLPLFFLICSLWWISMN